MEGKNRCKNCEKEFDTSFNFCPHCGQNANDQLTIRVLFNNTISNYFSVDARFFRSLFPLVFQPGTLARRFVDGKRQVYLHPAQYYLFISVIFFFLFSIATRDHGVEIETNSGNINFGDTSSIRDQLKEKNVELSQAELATLDSVMKNPYYDNSQTYGFTDKGLDSMIAAGTDDEALIKHFGYEEKDGKVEKFFYLQLLKIYKNRAGGLVKTFYDTIPVCMFFLLPIFALILKLFYRNSGRFSHHMVFSFYYFTFIFLFLSLIMLLGFWVEFPDWMITILVLLVFVYLLAGMKKFYSQSWIRVFFKGIGVTMAYLFLVMPISFLIMVLIAFVSY